MDNTIQQRIPTLQCLVAGVSRPAHLVPCLLQTFVDAAGTFTTHYTAFIDYDWTQVTQSSPFNFFAVKLTARTACSSLGHRKAKTDMTLRKCSSFMCE